MYIVITSAHTRARQGDGQSESTSHDVQWIITQRIEDLDFPKHIRLTPKQIKLRGFVQYGKQVELKINVSKTKLLQIQHNCFMLLSNRNRVNRRSRLF